MSGIIDPANFQCSSEFLDSAIKDQNMAGKMGKIQQYFQENRSFDREFMMDNRRKSKKDLSSKNKKNRVSINSPVQNEGKFTLKTRTNKPIAIKVSTESPAKIKDNFETLKSPVKMTDNFQPKHKSPLKSSNENLRKELLQKLSTPNKSEHANLFTSTPTKESASSPIRKVFGSTSDEDDYEEEEETNDDVFGSNMSNSDLAEIAEVSKNFKHIMKDLDHVNIRTESERELLGIRVDELGGVILHLQKELEEWKSQMDEYKMENEALLAQNYRLSKDYSNQKVKNGVLENKLENKEKVIRQQMSNLSTKEAENDKIKSQLVASAVVVLSGLAFLLGTEIQLFSF